MSKDTVVVRKLDKSECWDFLGRSTFARLAYHLRGHTRIAPINYALDGQRIIFRTAEGSKFYALQVDDAVAFEIDAYDDDEAWSVVAQGRVALEIDEHDAATARSVVIQGHVSEILQPEEIKDATVHLRPWVRTEKKHVLAIAVDKITGREFAITPHG